MLIFSIDSKNSEFDVSQVQDGILLSLSTAGLLWVSIWSTFQDIVGY